MFYSACASRAVSAAHGGAPIDSVRGHKVIELRRLGKRIAVGFRIVNVAGVSSDIAGRRIGRPCGRSGMDGGPGDV